MKGTIPSQRAFHSSVLLKNNFICFYGGVLQNNEISKEMFIYDINKKEFSSIVNEISMEYVT